MNLFYSHMKNFRILLFSLLVSLTACKKSETPVPTSEPDPVINVPSDPGIFISSPGSPIGGLVTANIGASGGSITSADGKATLTIPSGALSSSTSIGIQEISNTGPWGFGSAYRFTPDGLTFSTAATLSISYDPSDLNGKPEDFVWIYTQIANGSWKASLRSSVNTVTKIVSTPVKHFSDWGAGRFIELSLNPSSPVVMVNKSVNLFISGFKLEDPDGDDLAPLLMNHISNDDDLAPLVPITGSVNPQSTFEQFDITGWSLNGAMAPVSSSAGNLSRNSKIATYTAPAQIPSINPVAVSVHMKSFNVLSGVASNYLLTSNITVIESNLMVSFTFNGIEHTYYQWGYNNLAPPDPMNYNQVGTVLTNGILEFSGSKFVNGNLGPNMLFMAIQSPAVGSRTLAGPVLNGEDRVDFYDGDVTNAPFYENIYNVRVMNSSSICEVTEHNSIINLSISKYEGVGGIIEGTFIGQIHNQPDNASTNCTSDIPANISGFFRLKVLD